MGKTLCRAFVWMFDPFRVGGLVVLAILQICDPFGVRVLGYVLELHTKWYVFLVVGYWLLVIGLLGY